MTAVSAILCCSMLLRNALLTGLEVAVVVIALFVVARQACQILVRGVVARKTDPAGADTNSGTYRFGIHAPKDVGTVIGLHGREEVLPVHITGHPDHRVSADIAVHAFPLTG